MKLLQKPIHYIKKLIRLGRKDDMSGFENFELGSWDGPMHEMCNVNRENDVFESPDD